ncbi:YitT family protein [Mucilaginibacter robiniae]|uniref:YitT family protein n=1 Tax=Mucilaginibacter robiniae TaxID=2728022 RepID=A0A7L5DZY2_9SPHI|nr:YitT family protein [Mucilaginibacter robiniae]QJD96331.1 YitT family protein [Mucilaginibacter robiniae]
MKVKEILTETLLIVFGILSAAFGLKGFLLSSHFIDGGVTGISMLISDITGSSISIWLLIINLPFIFLAYRQQGMAFAIKGALAIAGLSLCVAFVHFPDVTHDKLLTAVFGGFFIGVGIGLAIRGGAVLDGTDIAALMLSKKSQLLKVNDIILLLNVIVFTLAAFFLGIESAMYSTLTYLAASKMIDFILNGIEQYIGVTIISVRSKEIQDFIQNNMKRGVTVYVGRGGYGKVGHIQEERDILFTVVTRLEIPTLKEKVLKIDASAFVVQQSIDDTTGGLMKRKSVH